MVEFIKIENLISIAEFMSLWGGVVGTHYTLVEGSRLSGNECNVGIIYP